MFEFGWDMFHYQLNRSVLQYSTARYRQPSTVSEEGKLLVTVYSAPSNSTCSLLSHLSAVHWLARHTHTSTHARDTYLAGSQPHRQDDDEGKSSPFEMDEQDARPTCAVGHTRI